MSKPDSSAIRGLGEIALRVRNLDVMQKFYQEVVGLTLLRRFPTSAFFKIADGYGGHTQVLALFDRSGESNYLAPDAPSSSIDHIAFEVLLDDFAGELARLKSLGVEVSTAEHSWVHWRSLYVTDPEGNHVELVCYDETI